MNVIDVLEAAKGHADESWGYLGAKGKTCVLGLILLAEGIDLRGGMYLPYERFINHPAVDALAEVAPANLWGGIPYHKVYMHNDRNLSSVYKVKEFFDQAIANYVNKNLPVIELSEDLVTVE